MAFFLAPKERLRITARANATFPAWIYELLFTICHSASLPDKQSMLDPNWKCKVFPTAVVEEIGLGVEQAVRAAPGVLLHNACGPCQGLPRAAGWDSWQPLVRRPDPSPSPQDDKVPTLSDPATAWGSEYRAPGRVPSRRFGGPRQGGIAGRPGPLLVSGRYRPTAR